MRRFKFSKLVRDKIVQSVIDAGNTPHWRTLTNDEYIAELKKKIVEEANEIPSSSREELLKELADVQEIIDNLLEALNINKADLQAAQSKKNEKAGSFKNKQYIEDVEAQDDSEWVQYYLNSPEKYPEVKK
jgi:predicted house-cleaning noncanonical NTP pyrophosphatase (MazG superfamily)